MCSNWNEVTHQTGNEAHQVAHTIEIRSIIVIELTKKKKKNGVIVAMYMNIGSSLSWDSRQ